MRADTYPNSMKSVLTALLLFNCSVFSSTTVIPFSDPSFTASLLEDDELDGIWDRQNALVNGSYSFGGVAGRILHSTHFNVDLNSLGINPNDVVSVRIETVHLASVLAMNGMQVEGSFADIGIFSAGSNALDSVSGVTTTATAIGTLPTSTVPSLSTNLATAGLSSNDFRTNVNANSLTVAQQQALDNSRVSTAISLSAFTDEFAINGGDNQFSFSLTPTHLDSSGRTSRSQIETTINGRTNNNAQGNTGTFGDLGNLGPDNGITLIIETVPEPSSLLLVGLASTFIIGRRKRTH